MESSTTILIRESAMATVFVEAHPKGGHSPHVARVRHLNDKKGLKRGDAFRLRWPRPRAR
jgi:hypothetical protein